jgi:hypothetical protein
VRSRYVGILCLAGTAAAVVRALFLLASTEVTRDFLGIVLRGPAAVAFTWTEIALLLTGVWGLWRLRPWARIGAMSYLAAVILSFLFFGVASSEGSRAAWTLVWQVSMVPFATFCFMFLYNDRRRFEASVMANPRGRKSASPLESPPS